MNILFFMIPKQDVAYIYSDFTLRQALEKMEYHQYAAIPIIDRDSKYVGTITEGDLLWTIKKLDNMNLKKAENMPIMMVKRRMDNKPVSASTSIEELISTSMNQNFVPVVDDRGVFIGIVTRKSILQYCCRKTHTDSTLYWPEQGLRKRINQ